MDATSDAGSIPAASTIYLSEEIQGIPLTLYPKWAFPRNMSIMVRCLPRKAAPSVGQLWGQLKNPEQELPPCR